MQESVEYLGYKINAEGLHAAADKVEAIANAPKLTDVKQLRSFLGLVNYYGKFVKDLATIAHPLHNLLRRNVNWKWTSSCETAFRKLKEQLTSSAVLVHYDPSLPLKLACDASSYGLGVVAAQTELRGWWRTPPAHYLRVRETTLKEALSITFGFKRFHQFLYIRYFTLVDHKPLTTILGPKSSIPTLAAARLQRWAILLAAYQYTLWSSDPLLSMGMLTGYDVYHSQQRITQDNPIVLSSTVFK